MVRPLLVALLLTATPAPPTHGADTSPVSDDVALAEASRLTFDLGRDFDQVIATLEPRHTRLLAATDSDPVFLAELEHTLGHARFYAGQAPAVAERLLVSAVARYTAALGPEHATTLNARGDLAIFYARTGRPDLAEPLKREVAETFRRVAPDSNDTQHALAEWAIQLGRLGRWSEAETILREAIARRTVLQGPDHPDLSHPLNLLAWVLFSTDRTAETVPVLENLVRLRTAHHGRTATATLTVRYNLASAHERLGQLAAAENLLREDLELVTVQPDSWHETAGYEMRLGRLALRYDDASGAVALLASAVAHYRAPRSEGWRDADSRDLENTLRLLAYAQHLTGDRTAALASAHAWLELLEQQFRLRLGYTSEADRLAFFREQRPFDLPATLADPDLLARVATRLTGLVLDSLIEDAALARAATDPAVAALLDDYRAALAANAPALEALEKQLVRAVGGVTLPRDALATDPAAILRALAPTEAVVIYLRHHPFALDSPDPATARYTALLGTRADGWRVVPLPAPASAIDDAVARYQILTQSPGPIAWARELRELALDPVRARLPAGIKTLLLVPDGGLHRVNFASLPEETPATFVVQSLRCAWLDTPRALLRPAASVPLAERSLRVLAAADSPRPDLPSLPGARVEAQRLQALWPDAELHLEGDATPAAALASPAPAILHFAAHGLWNPGADSSAGTLQRAGIVLNPTGTDDGFLSAARLAAHDLSGTALVVVSACGSGAGPVLAGEGVLGLRRALARAGAPHALLALWLLDDALSPDMLAAFYAALRDGAAPAAAHQAALARILPELARREGEAAALRRAGALIIVGRP